MYCVYSDGGSRGNPGPSAYAIVVTKDGKTVHEHAEFLGVHTNNYAEYRGLIAGISKALELGADDYVVKPFDSKEVVARIKAVLRRCTPAEAQPDGVISYDKLSVDLTRYELKVNGQVVDAPPKELELLYYLASHPNRVFTRDQLLDEVWGFEYYGDSRTIDVHVKRLREKLENTSDQWSLKTVWGVGYKFEVKE